MIEGLESRTLYSVTTTTECVKQPGPTDTAVTVATNPAGRNVPGQSGTETVSNRECRTRH
jgi:hypothetical protein